LQLTSLYDLQSFVYTTIGWLYLLYSIVFIFNQIYKFYFINYQPNFLAQLWQSFKLCQS